MLAFSRVENRQRHLEETSCLAASRLMPANSTGSLALSWPLRAAFSRPAGRLKDSLLLVRELTTTLLTYNNVGNITEIAVTPHRSRGVADGVSTSPGVMMIAPIGSHRAQCE